MLESRELLRQLEEQGVHLYAEGDRLRLNAPRGVVTPEMQAVIAERKSDLLRLLREAPVALLDIPIEPVARDRPQPLSISQERLWGMMQMAGDTPLYNMYLAFRLTGELDRNALTSSLASLVQRHEPLRTHFGVVDGQPVQQVRGLDEWSPVFLDLSDEAQREAHVAEYLRREASYPFDPQKEALFRASLLRLSETEHILVLVMHHLISDGWSWDVFLRELASLYADCHRGASMAFTELPIQYLDFTSWQRRFVDSPRFATQVAYWAQTLQGVAALELPLDAARTPSLDFAGSRIERTLPSALAAKVRDLAIAENATPFMTLLAVFQATLHRVTGQRNLLIGTPVSGRSYSGFQNILGYFNNILPLRISVSEQDTFHDLLAKVRGMALGAYEHADVPLHCLTDQPDLRQVPFTRAVFALQDGSGFTLTLDDLQVEPLPVYNQTSNFDLFLTVRARAEEMSLVAEYRTALFRAETIHHLLDDYLTLLGAALGNSGMSLADLLPSPQTVMKQTENPRREHRYTAPASPLQSRLVALWEELFDRRPIGVEDNFFELGGHSLLALRLFARIEQEFNANLPLTMLFDDLTIARLARAIEGESTGTSWTVLVPIQPNGTRPPFFAVHGVEGGVLGYRDLARALGDDHPFLGLQAVGQDGRQAYDLSVEAMAARYIGVMRATQPQGPYRIGGYCFGGVVAYEMARQLEKIGEQVSLLAVFEGAMAEEAAPRVPFLRRLGAILNHLPTWVKDYSSMSPRQLGNRLRSTYKKIWSRLQRNSEVERRMRVEETLDINVDHLPSKHIELTDTNMKAALRYEPGAYNGVVTLFRARNRSINEIVFGSLDPTMGWGRLAKGGVHVRPVDGFHRNMHLAPYASSLASELRKCLDADSKGEGSSGV